MHYNYCTGPLKDVRKMAKHQLDEVKLQLISQPHLEVACTLVYSDNHTQLRLKKVPIIYNNACT